MRESPEVRFFKSTPGMITAVGLGVAALAGVAAWVVRARGEERREREAIVVAAAGGTALAWGFTAIARQQGWIRGAYFELPIASQLALNGGLSVGFYTAWLQGYRWLTENARHPHAIYGVVSALYGPLAVQAGSWEIERGYFRLGNGWKLGYNAAVTQPMLWAPVLMYEGLRDRLPVAGVRRPEAVESQACGMPKESMLAFGSV